MKRILIAEDDTRISAFLAKKLQINDYATTVVEDGYQVLHLITHHQFDLLILDLVLPGKDGEEVLTELRGQGHQIPIIILSARDEIQDKVTGLESGANDYMTKPFSFEELLARIRLQLRSPNISQEPKSATVVQFGNITLDIHQRNAKVEGREIKLSNQEFILLDTLMRHPHQVLSREELLNYVWGYNYDPNSNIVDVYVGYLRKKLGNDVIETVRGVGYRLQNRPLA